MSQLIKFKHFRLFGNAFYTKNNPTLHFEVPGYFVPLKLNL
nr:MAG TPA: hypothetical protein [Caudoviricetes sp.]